MVANITYTKTTRGQRAFIKGLPDAAGQVLMVIDGDLTEEEIRFIAISEANYVKHVEEYLAEKVFQTHR